MTETQRTGTQKESLRQRKIVRDPEKGAGARYPKREGQRPHRDKDMARDSSRDAEIRSQHSSLAWMGTGSPTL